MKKQMTAFFLTALLLLGGCSLVEKVNNTVTYVAEATNYVGEVAAFVNEAPTLVEQAAANDEAALSELETRLESLKQNMEAFNQLEAPEIATDLHQQIVNQNQQAAEGIDLLLNNIEDGKLDPTVLENVEIFQSLQEIANTIDQIKQLGGQ